MNTRLLRVGHFLLSLRQTLFDRFLLVRCATAEALLKDLDRRWLQKKEVRVEIGLLDLLDTLEHEILLAICPPIYHISSKAEGPQPTSISISKIQILPFSAMSFTACMLVP